MGRYLPGPLQPAPASVRREIAAWLVAFSTEAAAAAGPLGLGAGFIDAQRSAVEVRPVESGDGFFALAIIAHFDEAKSPGLAGIAIGGEVDAANGAVCFKKGADGVFRRSKAEISYVNILHVLKGPLLT